MSIFSNYSDEMEKTIDFMKLSDEYDRFISYHNHGYVKCGHKDEIPFEEGMEFEKEFWKNEKLY